MKNIRNGVLSISEGLTIYPGFSFEQFKRTEFYKNQDSIKMIYLEGRQIIDNRKYMVSLFSRMAHANVSATVNLTSSAAISSTSQR